jgi:aspartate/methionine/tyrosine aminotransferase
MNPTLKGRVNFSPDLVAKADRYLANIPGMGAYTDSQGILAVREDVSKFLEQRDGYPSDPKDIFLTNGASEGVRVCMQTFLRDANSGFKDGILAPIPQYPLYSALTTLLAGTLEPYYLDESKSWGCTKANLQESLTAAKANGTTIRALVVINPGNPTGQVLEEANMREIIQFCAEEGICLMADEVYQENIWKEGSKFVSFRKVALDMGMSAAPSDNNKKSLQMVSFHSISKVCACVHVSMCSCVGWVCWSTYTTVLCRCIKIYGCECNDSDNQHSVDRYRLKPIRTSITPFTPLTNTKCARYDCRASTASAVFAVATSRSSTSQRT